MENFLAGLELFLLWENFLVLIVGVVVGMIIGILPGLTVTMAVAVLLPLTFQMPPIMGIAMLLGVYKGGIYAGSISAILINTPGTPAAAATCIDGYELYKQGKGEKALKMALYSSVSADIFSDIVLIVMAVHVARFAMRFGPPEIFSVMIFSLTIIAGVSGDSLLKGLLSGALGLLLATVGMDPMMGFNRFSFGLLHLSSGIEFIPMLIGMYALSEVLLQIESGFKKITEKVNNSLERGEKDRRLTWLEFKASIRTIFRSAIIGTIIGAIPGIGSAVAAFFGYSRAKAASKNPKEYGRGSLDGIAAAEAGNNAVCGATLIPLLTMGIPGDAITAVLLGALMLQGLTPGPLLFQQAPDIIVGIYIALLLANVILFVIAFYGLKLFSKVILISPKQILFPVIFIFCALGAFAVANHIFDVKTLVFFGIIGFVLRKFKYPLAPINIAFLLGGRFEAAFRRSLTISHGDYSIFFTRPISAIMLGLTLLSVIFIFRSSVFGGKKGVIDTPQ